MKLRGTIIMKANKAYKFRLYPNKDQIILFEKTFGCVRFIWNQMLSDKISYYEQEQKVLNNSPAQYKNKYEWLKEIDSLALANVWTNLNQAFKNFFNNKKFGFPKYKNKKQNKNSYTTFNQKGTIRLSDDTKYVKLPKLGYVRIKCHRQIQNNEIIKSATISKNPSGKYYISILVEYEKEIPQLILDKEKSLGLDYSSSSFYVDSQGNEANYPRYFRLLEDKLAKESRKLSRMQKGSKNRNKQRIKVAKIHEHISNCRKDFCHKLSHKLSDKYDYICLEDINLHGMAQALHLGKSTNDNGFGMFRQFLSYKMFEKGKQLIKIDKWFPSSKMCHICGCINLDLKLSDRVWICDCGAILNRDQNAAINIRTVGLSQTQ